jgi:hypothetical protein
VYQGEIATDHDGNLSSGTWPPLVGEDTFDVIQARLSDLSRRSNRVGTDRRYIGSGLYLCAQCEAPVQTANGGKYFCSGHLIREHRQVGQFVLDLIAERLANPDLSALLAPVGNDMKPVVEESKALRARPAKIDNEYDGLFGQGFVRLGRIHAVNRSPIVRRQADKSGSLLLRRRPFASRRCGGSSTQAARTSVPGNPLAR